MKKINYIKSFVIVLLSVFLLSCSNTRPKTKTEDHHQEQENSVSLSKEQVKAISLKMGELQKMNLNSFVVTNGLIEVPPQHRVEVNAILGANIRSINVLAGQSVTKGDILATLEHPHLIDIQVDYKKAYSKLEYLKKEYKRLKTLASKNIASGKELQIVEADYYTANAEFVGLKTKIEMIGADSRRLIDHDAQSFVALRAPISGVVSNIKVHRGKYVEPQTEMFEIMNTKHLHADLQVYEKDLTKVKKDQEVILTLNEHSDIEYTGKVISIGKTFDETTRSITVQVEISPVPDELVPGLFVKGRIIIDNKMLTAVPLDAVVSEGDKSYIFIADDDNKDHGKADKDHAHKSDGAISLKMVEVVKGVSDRGFIEIRPLTKINAKSHIALNGAYYLLAEMKKSEAEHSH